MDAQTFLEVFETIAEAPGGIAKLRELILQLAVQGKLVPQDPHDEPASVLLERIAKDKMRLVHEGTLKRQKHLSPVDEDDLPFNIPTGWSPFRLVDVAEFAGGATPSTNRSEYWGQGIPWVSPKDMKADNITTTELEVTDKALEETRLRLIPPQSLLIVARSGILKRLLPVAINLIVCTVNQDMKVLIPFDTHISKFLRLMLRGHQSYILQELVKGGVTVQSLKYADFEVHPFVLPPLAEQHRIVAKVDELMALCDQLEERQTQRNTTRKAFQESALDALANAETPDELATAWKRVRSHWDVITAQPDSIGALRQAILQLAVRGKLVPQDPNDEPASVRLERIAVEKAHSEKGKKPKKHKQCLSISEDEMPFEIPSSWKYARLEAVLADESRNGLSAKPEQDPPGVEILRISAGTARSDAVILEEDHRFLNLDEETARLYELRRGDLLACRFNGNLHYVGKVAVYEKYRGRQQVYPDTQK